MEKDGTLEVQAVCVVSRARGTARTHRAEEWQALQDRMQALAVKEEMRGRGLAAEALRRLQVELGELAGTDYRMVADITPVQRWTFTFFRARLSGL